MQFTPEFVSRVRDSELVRKLNEERVLELDNSEYSKWSSCFVQGLYYGALKRTSVKGQAALVFGRAVHEGLAARLSGNDDDEAIKKALKVAEDDRLDEMLDPVRNRQRLVELLLSYFIHCEAAGEWLRPVVVDGQPLVEQSFRVKLGHVIVGGVIYEIWWKGKIDVVVRSEGDLWIVDHKTTTVMGEKFMDDKIRGNQFLGYTWAATELLKGIETPKGVITNALALRKSGFEFKQFKMPISELVLKEWEAETVEACGELIRKVRAVCELASDQDQTIVSNREACVTKYGRCSYFDACEMASKMRERVLFDESFYKHNDWDPLD